MRVFARPTPRLLMRLLRLKRAIVLLRNVIERRAELATLRAVGFPARSVVRLILAENLAGRYEDVVVEGDGWPGTALERERLGFSSTDVAAVVVRFD